MDYRFVIYLLRKEGDVYHILKKKVVRKPEKTVKVLGKMYAIDFSSPLFVRGKERVYAVEFQSGSQFGLEGAKTPAGMTPEELDVVVGTKVIRELTQSVAHDIKDMVFPLVLGVCLGALVAWIVAQFVWQAKVDELVRMLSEQNTFNPFNPSGTLIVNLARTLGSVTRDLWKWVVVRLG